jgi:hypothetical protein
MQGQVGQAALVSQRCFSLFADNNQLVKLATLKHVVICMNAFIWS